jgi:hypothetical protein
MGGECAYHDPVLGSSRIDGLLMIGLGAWAWLPATGRLGHRLRRSMFRRAPWLERLPGAGVIYGETSQDILRKLAGTVLIVVGALVTMGIVGVH